MFYVNSNSIIVLPLLLIALKKFKFEKKSKIQGKGLKFKEILIFEERGGKILILASSYSNPEKFLGDQFIVEKFYKKKSELS